MENKKKEKTKIDIILPNWPIDTENEFLSFLNIFFFVKSIIRYFFLSLIFLYIYFGKSVSPKISPIIIILILW